MITIELPEWIGYLLIIIALLETISIGQKYLIYKLNKKLAETVARKIFSEIEKHLEEEEREQSKNDS